MGDRERINERGLALLTGILYMVWAVKDGPIYITGTWLRVRSVYVPLRCVSTLKISRYAGAHYPSSNRRLRLLSTPTFPTRLLAKPIRVKVRLALNAQLWSVHVLPAYM